MATSELASQGVFRVKRHLDGRVWITMPPHVIVPRDVAIEMARAILQMARVEVIVSDPGQTVIRANGNGKVR